MPAGPLFRIKPPGKVQVSLSAVVGTGEPPDEPTKQLVQELDEIGVQAREGRPAESAP